MVVTVDVEVEIDVEEIDVIIMTITGVKKEIIPIETTIGDVDEETTTTEEEMIEMMN